MDAAAAAPVEDEPNAFCRHKVVPRTNPGRLPTLAKEEEAEGGGGSGRFPPFSSSSSSFFSGFHASEVVDVMEAKQGTGPALPMADGPLGGRRSSAPQASPPLRWHTRQRAPSIPSISAVHTEGGEEEGAGGAPFRGTAAATVVVGRTRRGKRTSTGALFKMPTPA